MIREKLNQLLADYRAVTSQVKTETAILLSAEDSEANALEAQKILQTVATTVQEEAHSKLAGVVTRSLEAVFDDPYEFKIEFERKRGRTEANLVFVRRGLELSDPVNSVGGGVLDVAAFALRIACLALEKPLKRRFLSLDEPFSRIRGEENRKRMRDLVQSLADDFEMQFVINIDADQFPEFLLGSVVNLG